jgi:cell division cycle protein 20 (cofactor of APC complex)
VAHLAAGATDAPRARRWQRKELESQKTPSRKRALLSHVLDSPNGGTSPSSSRPAAGAENTPSGKPAKQAKKFTPSSRQASSDRFIPTRACLDFENANYKVVTQESEAPPTPASHEAHEFKRALADTLVPGDSRVLAFRKKAPAPSEDFENPQAVLYTKRASAHKPATATRFIPHAPEKILDAPDLLNDFYISPLDWSSGNQLGVALGSSVFLWNAGTGGIRELCTLQGEYASAVKFVQEGGAYLAVGSSDKTVGLWDVETQKLMRRMNGHSARVSCLAWNGHILTSGGRDSSIVHHDVRVQNHIVGVLHGHAQEVCSLHWSPDGTTLASGSNDNTVCVWDAAGAQAEPRLRLTHHQAAVKAMAWCPWQRNVLATGGGTSDRTIKVWSTVTGVEQHSIDTGSQVCSLLFNANNKELLSSHGFSENQLTLWKFPHMTRIKDLTGHTARVLHTAVSPDGTTVCSAASDETLRLWKCFGSAPAPSKDAKAAEGRPAGGALRMSLR